MPEAWLLLVVGLCILAAVAVDVLCFGGSPQGARAAATTDYPLPGVTGALQLHGHGTESLNRAAATVGGPCKGLGPFDGLLGGTQVVVRNQTDAVIATGALNPGTVVDGSTCEFAFIVQALPRADAYQFAVAQRTVQTYTYDDLAASGWQVTLTLG
jgi:hypothetical protein